MQNPGGERKTALIVVRTYPSPAKNGVEVSCTAAITAAGDWLRLFPVPWRYLPTDKRFRRYQWINVGVAKPSRDIRPESFKLDATSIEILSNPLSTQDAWRARKDVVFPMRAHCLCCLKAERDARGYPSLGIFRPKSIDQLLITPDSPNWSDAQLMILRQRHLFDETPKQELEKIPYVFRYQFRCKHDECPGHKLTCTDWEMAESYRKWRRAYGVGWEEKFRARYESDMINKYDTHFYVGTVHKHPHIWIICGLFYPPSTVNNDLTLFDLGEMAERFKAPILGFGGVN